MIGQKFLIGLFAGLAVGAVGGYFIAVYTPPQSGSGASAPQETVKGASAGSSAVGDIETNPYEGVRFNPFE